MTTTAQNIIAAGFDISNLMTPDAAPVTFNVDLVFDKDGEAVAGFIIVGANSTEHREVDRAIRSEGYKKSARRKTAIDASTEGGADQLVDLIDGNANRTAIAVVVGWYGFMKDGAAIPFDKATVAAAFEKYPSWQARVLDAMKADSNFLKV
jgi:hypothetical protein